MRIDLGPDGVGGLELDDLVGARPDGGEIRRRVAGAGAAVRPEDVPGDDLATETAEDARPERRRRLERHPDGVAVDRLDARHVAVAAEARAARRGVHPVLPVEHDVVGGEGLAVVPGHVPLQPPRDRSPVGGQAAVLEGRDLGGQDRHEVPVAVEGGQRLVEDARGRVVLEAAGEVRVQDGRGVRHQDPELAAAAAPARRRHGRGLRARRPGRGEHLGGHGRADADGEHRPHEAPASQPARLRAI